MVLAFFLVESMSSTNTFCVAKSLSFPCKLNFHPAIVQRAPGQFFERYLLPRVALESHLMQRVFFPRVSKASVSRSRG
jgi:hypothetical protein